MYLIETNTHIMSQKLGFMLYRTLSIDIHVLMKQTATTANNNDLKKEAKV